MDTEKLLETYQDDRGTDLRNEILVGNLALVHHVARRVMSSRCGPADYDDLVSAGTVGLIEAIEHFDPSRGHAFSTYASPRIRGAMLDDLRRRDHASRSLRKKVRSIGRARETLMARLERDPKDAEVARELDVDVETFWQWQGKVVRADQVSLDEPIREEGGSATRRAFLVGDDGAGIESAVNESQEAEILQREIAGLPEQERTVLALYYFEELKLREIGEVLGLTESRISQIRTKALETLRKRMAPLAGDLAA